MAHLRWTAGFLVVTLLPLSFVGAQPLEWDRMHDIDPHSYVAYRVAEPVVVDGRLDEPQWQSASWSEAFVDIEGEDHPAPAHETRMKITWDGDYLYVGARLVEPHVWGTLTEKNSIIYRDNDFEIFIDPDGDRHDYYEFEVNPLNTIMELTMNRPYSDGGDYDLGTNIRGLRSAVYVEGTLNAPHDEDEAWTVEVAIPWEGLRPYTPGPVPPADGDHWRINFSRVQWQHAVEDNVYVKVPDVPEDNWVWSPTGLVDMHRPERWGYVQFSTSEPGTDAFQPDPTLEARDVLMELYHRQRRFLDEHGHPAMKLEELEIPSNHEAHRLSPTLVAHDDGAYEIAVTSPISDSAPNRLVIDHEGRIREE